MIKIKEFKFDFEKIKQNKTIAPSIFNAYLSCKREAWLMHRQLTGDQDNLFLAMGRFISETTYTEGKKEIYLPDLNAKIDLVFRKNGEYFIAEVKKSSKMIKSAENQLKYYLYLLKNKGIEMYGFLKIPREKNNYKVQLTEDDIKYFKEKIEEIKEVLYSNEIPEAERKKICSKCSHLEFCWS